MGANSSKNSETHSVNDISKFITSEENAKIQELFNSIQGAKVTNLLQIWQGQLDKPLQQQVISYVSSRTNETIVNYTQFAKLFVHLVRGSVYDKTDTLIDVLTYSQRTEPIDRNTIINYVESLISSFILTHTNISWQKSARGDIRLLSSTLCSDLLPQVTQDNITSWLSNEPKVSALHAAVFGNLYKITTAKQRLVPTKDKKTVSNLLDICSVLFINSSLPSEMRTEWRLLFSSQKHGESFSKLLGYISNKGPTVLVVKDRSGCVFGGFAPQPWALSPNFVGNDTSFLYRIKPTMKICHATNINNHYQYLNLQQQTMPNGLGMGGQYDYWGMWLDSEFGVGQSSETCTTYRNYTMLSSAKEFHFDSLEVWAVGPLPVVEEQYTQRSVLDSNTEARAMLDMIGKTSHSDGLREPQEEKY